MGRYFGFQPLSGFQNTKCKIEVHTISGGCYKILKVNPKTVAGLKLFLGSLNNRTRSYWGIGPLIGFSYEDRKDSRYDQEGEVLDEYSFLIRQWNFGALALVGVEYFFLPNISLHGEYGFDLKYSVSESTRSDSKAKNLRLNSRSVRLGLCVLY